MIEQRPSTEFFLKGVAALENRRYLEALESFKTALDIESHGQPTTLRTKYLSFLGLALTLAYGVSDESEKLCEHAAKRGFLDPDLHCNLGIVHLRKRRKKQAFESFATALALQPGHARTLEEIGRFDRRSKPALRFLPRRHSLNITLGRIRHRMRQRFAPGEDEGP